jgi:hypothetical protein
MRWIVTLALAAAFSPATASALDVHGDFLARGWFFGATGEADRTDLKALGFDRAKGQPEFEGRLVVGERHHAGVSYLHIRRQEEGTVDGTILGILRFQDDVSLDLDVDYVRAHYGYSLLSDSWIDLQPFLELAYLHESTDLIDRTFGVTSHQKEDVVFPLPGVEVVVAPAFPVCLKAHAEGMGIPRGHLIDVVGGLEGQWGLFVAGVGYRYLKFVVDDHGQTVADVRLKGVYAEGGLRF